MSDKTTPTDEEVMDKAIKDGRTIPSWMDKAGREIGDIIHAEVWNLGMPYYPGFSRIAFWIFKHCPESYEESAATIRSLLYAFEHANNRDHPYTDWCDGCNPKAALAQARRSK